MNHRGSICLWLGLVMLAGGPRAALGQEDYQTPSKVNLSWNRLNTYDEVVKICRELVAAYPELLSMQSIGKSVGGREMWALTLNVGRTGPDTGKPAMYIDANIHGNEVQGTEVVLYSIWYLTKSYGHVPQLTELMDRCAFYFVPMVNPDGRAYWFDSPNNMHSSRGGARPVDNDGDGLFDEDPPNDLDGDGRLLEMRRLNPNGRWRESPDDPRILVPVQPDAKGEFKRYDRLGPEGVDDDGDGEINEDGVGGYDPNRDWPAQWRPRHIQYGAMDFPLSLPESKSIADFILAHPNIAAVQSYHNSGGMILRGPGAKEFDYPQQDAAVYDRIGKLGEQMLPFYRYMIIWKDLYTVYGGTVNWTAEDLGIISFTNELWADNQYYNRDKDPTPAERMAFNDHLMFGQAFVPWKKAQHPVYGDIELGGWMKLTGRIQPSFMMEEMCHRNFAFTMLHADQMPLIELRDVEVTPAGEKLWRVRVDVHNRRLIPTTTQQCAKQRYGPRDFVEISGAGIRVVAGGERANRLDSPLEFVEHNAQKLWIDTGIPGESLRTFEWLVSGEGEAVIRFSGPRAGTVDTRATLKRE